MTHDTINVSEVIDHSRLGAVQLTVVVLCATSLLMDGFDVQTIGYVGPALTRDLNVASAALAPVFAAGLFGILLGSLLFSVLADKVGRRPVLIGATFYYAVLSLATAFAQTLDQLVVIRFVAGLGLGAIMPNAVSLVSEYSPRRSRATLMMIVANGFTIGAAFGGFVSAWLIPSFGWRSVFVFGGAVPLAVAVAMWAWLPESLPLMVSRGKTHRRMGEWLRRVDPSLAVGPGTTFVAREQPKGGFLVAQLFQDGRAAATVLLWIIYFMNLVNLYALSAWLPTVVRDSGYSAQTAVWVGTMLQVGGVLGTFALGWLIDRFGFIAVLGVTLSIGCVGIALIGQQGLTFAFLVVTVFVAGWCVIGGQSAVNALAGTYYPTHLRSTGIGWGLGIGRVGAIVGPLMAGEFIRRQWSAQDIFLAAALPACISAVAMFALWLPFRHVSAAVTRRRIAATS
jgi:AAHS family 4-hydroxybenzoate transporter-like MFS transporter